MNRAIFLLFSLTFSLSITAQGNHNLKNLVVSLADLQNNSYPKDSTANAYYIYQKGFSRIENGGNYNLLTDYEAKIKLINKKGFHKATIEVHLYNNKSRREKIRKIVAYTHTLENGKIVRKKVEENQIFREKYDENHTLVKFTFPAIRPGAVLTYSYQLESPFIYNFNGWDFQDDIPKLYSEYITDLPGNYVYNIRLRGTLKLDTNESTIKRNCLETGRGTADCSHNVYIMKNIPAFKEEQYMTAKKNYFSRVAYELKEFKGFDGINTKYTETWKNVDTELKGEPNIGVQLKKINITKDILPEDIRSMTKDLVKAKAIYKWFTNHYSWNKNDLTFKTEDQAKVKKVIETKTGNVSGINILLHNILKQQGFDVHSVMASTRENGYPTKIHPVISDFNYLFVQLSLNDKTYLLDATENTLAFGEVPFRCLNQYGRLLDFKKGSSWIDITSKQRSAFYYSEKITLNEQLELQGSATHVYSGYHGVDIRKTLGKNNKQSFIDLIEEQELGGLIINDLSFKNEENPEKPFEMEFSYSRGTEEIENIIYIKPFTTPFYEENPFKLNERTYPVDFGFKGSYSYMVELKIPEGYDFVDIPESSTYALPNSLGKVRIGFLRNGQTLSLAHRITFGSSYYPTEYYAALKEFFNLVVQIENDTFITVKKTS